MSDTEVKDNSKLFRKIVRDFNKEYGYSFKLPKDTDYSSKYAHPVHEADGIKITSQIDDSNKSVYAMRFVIDGIEVYLGYRDREHADILKAVRSPQFEQRLMALRQLRTLSEELASIINTIQQNIMDDTITDIERDETYDTITRAARQIYKDSGAL